MKYLIDTHILIWYIEGDQRLSKMSIEIIENPKNTIFISNASFWEITIKLSINKLKMSLAISQLDAFLEDNNFSILDFNFLHLDTLSKLPFHHNDPFDRLVIAQAITESMPIITNDSQFNNYELKIIN